MIKKLIPKDNEKGGRRYGYSKERNEVIDSPTLVLRHLPTTPSVTVPEYDGKEMQEVISAGLGCSFPSFRSSLLLSLIHI